MSRPARQIQHDAGPPPSPAVLELAKALVRLMIAEEDRAPATPGRPEPIR